MVRVSSIEWDFTNLSYALGSGNTTVPVGSETFAYGGEPAVTEVAIHIQHQMAQSGHTMDVYVWKAASASGVTLPFTHDEHTFEYQWEAIQSDTTWGGATLPQTEQLIKLLRTTA